MAKLVSVISMVLLLIAVPLGLWWFVFRPLPPRGDDVIALSGLDGQATVNFDSRGLPYIHAGNEPDLYMVQGYVTASDRLLQMDILRRKAEGELAEIFGAQGPALSWDRMMRTIGFNRLATQELSHLSPTAREALTSYCLGVNKYVADNSNRLPLEFGLLAYRPKPWRPEDTLAIIKYLDYIGDESWQLDDLRQRILDKLGQEKAADLFGDNWSATPNVQLASNLSSGLESLSHTKALFAPMSPTVGSSSFVIGPGHTDSGGAMLACDKHFQLTSPDLYYLVSLSAPTLHVAGATIPGVPGVVIGRNDSIAWGSCALKADVQDLFLEEFSPQFPDKYRTQNGWKTAKEITEVIPVRLGRSQEYKVLVTEHGPCLLRSTNAAVALAWTGLSPDLPSPLETILSLNKAKNYDEFQSAIESYAGSPQNFVFADRSGNIASHAAGVIPVRDKGGQGTTIVAGAGDVGQWVSTIQFKGLPQATNPKSHCLVAANQKPVSNAFPFLIGHQFMPPYRAYRAYALILQNGKRGGSGPMGLPDVNEIDADLQAPLADLIRQEIRKSLDANHIIDQNSLSCLNLLDRWDGQLRADSPEASIYESFIYTLGRRILEPKLGPALTAQYFRQWPMWICFVEQFMHNKQDKWLPPEERTYSGFIATTFVESIKQLHLITGASEPDKWAWKNIHKIYFEHQINQGLGFSLPDILFGTSGIGAGGDDNTLNTLSVDYDYGDRKLACRFGPALRTLIDMSDADKFYQGVSLGQSGQILSPHKHDQLNAWLRVDPMPVAFSQQQIDRQTEHKLVFTNHM